MLTPSSPWQLAQKKVSFYTRQYIDALSPSNFALTNPEVFRETVKTHGQNLIKGLNNLLRDVEECCEEVLILKKGRVAAFCNLEEERRANRKFLELETLQIGQFLAK